MSRPPHSVKCATVFYSELKFIIAGDSVQSSPMTFKLLSADDFLHYVSCKNYVRITRK